jgi:hypothetical protein
MLKSRPTIATNALKLSSKVTSLRYIRGVIKQGLLLAIVKTCEFKC